jgi:uncharacterized membrane protein YhaH (DUF805 family)
MGSTSGRDWLDPTRLYNPKIPAGRLLYLWGGWIYPLLWFLAVAIGAGMLEGMMGYYNESPIMDFLMVPTELAFIVAAVLMVLRRLRDLRTSGWALLVLFVPILNTFFGLFLLLAPGKHGEVASMRASAPIIAVEPVVPAIERQSPPQAPPIPVPAQPERPRRASACSRCGSLLDPAARYCLVCGAEVA